VADIPNHRTGRLMFVETYRGWAIRRHQDGFYWQMGGYCDTLEDCRWEIDNWCAALPQPCPQHEDTPELPPPWWSQR
jgi:hypothetical protein